MTYSISPPRILAIGLAFALMPFASQAACFAEYKAKRDNPLKLHYGIAELDDASCTSAAAAKALTPRLKADGWVLLSVLGFVQGSELEGKKESAGAYFLRY
ncbi:hypothetical protein EDD53_2589 [Pacificibacter maritimus]|uniref:Uncharacterized protein n=1 Tax=Pacificibacter maritimus TaxID=762213 RepID=A0A3N4U8Y9_9RHOB|nr:hypothetical protein [Pacificibacter maritimus]RPE64825.1 hypothetical protein EDD53_2589 [Pacificibacter maritimus]